MDVLQILTTASAFCAAAGYAPAVGDAWHVSGKPDEARPTISGWFSWLLADAVIFGASLESENIAWPILLYVAGSLSLICLSLRKNFMLANMRRETVSWRSAFADWSLKDTVCVLLVVIAVGIWGVHHDPKSAIYVSAFSTVIGAFAIAVPMVSDPYRESFWSWIIFLTGSLLAIYASDFVQILIGCHPASDQCVSRAVSAFDPQTGVYVLYTFEQLLFICLSGRRFIRPVIA